MKKYILKISKMVLIIFIFVNMINFGYWLFNPDWLSEKKIELVTVIIFLPLGAIGLLMLPQTITWFIKNRWLRLISVVVASTISGIGMFYLISLFCYGLNGVSPLRTRWIGGYKAIAMLTMYSLIVYLAYNFIEIISNITIKFIKKKVHNSG